MLGIEVLQKKNPARTSLAGRKILRGTTRFQEQTLLHLSDPTILSPVS